PTASMSSRWGTVTGSSGEDEAVSSSSVCSSRAGIGLDAKLRRLSVGGAAPYKGRLAHPRGRYGPCLTAVPMLRTMQAVGRRRTLIVLLGALVLASSAGASGSSLDQRLAKALAVPHVSRARTAALVFDLQTGITVFAQHDSLALAPASNE